MKIKIISFLTALFIMSGCARDLSSDMYTSDSTLNIVVNGKIISTRDIKIKENDKLSDNTIGAGMGALAGGAGAGALAGGSGNTAAAVIGGAVIGGVIGAAGESALSTTHGVEYIVQVDRAQISSDYYAGSSLMRNAIESIKATGIVTVIQAKEKGAQIFPVGQDVLVIISSKRTRIIPKNM